MKNREKGFSLYNTSMNTTNYLYLVLWKLWFLCWLFISCWRLQESFCRFIGYFQQLIWHCTVVFDKLPLLTFCFFVIIIGTEDEENIMRCCFNNIVLLFDREFIKAKIWFSVLLDLLFNNEEKRMKLRKENKTIRHAVELPDTLYTLFFLFNGMFLLFNKNAI